MFDDACQLLSILLDGGGEPGLFAAQLDRAAVGGRPLLQVVVDVPGRLIDCTAPSIGLFGLRKAVVRVLLERPSGLPNDPKGPHQLFRAAHVATAGAAHPGERLKLRRAGVASIR